MDKTKQFAYQFMVCAYERVPPAWSEDDSKQPELTNPVDKGSKLPIPNSNPLLFNDHKWQILSDALNIPAPQPATDDRIKDLGDSFQNVYSVSDIDPFLDKLGISGTIKNHGDWYSAWAVNLAVSKRIAELIQKSKLKV